MKKRAVLFSIILAAAVGSGSYYHFVYAPEHGSVFASVLPGQSNEEPAVVNQVKDICRRPNSAGLFQRYAGEVQTSEERKIQRDSEKIVKALYVKEGDFVQAGTPLFTYDTRADEQEIAKLEVEQEKLANENESREAKLQDFEKKVALAHDEDELLENKINILSEQNEIRKNVHDAKENTDEIERHKASIREATVKSEISGIVKSIGKENASYGMDDSAYITIMAVEDLQICGYANEQNVNQLSEGERVIIYSRRDDGLKWGGTISKINRQGEKSSTSGDDFYDYGGSEMTSSKFPFLVVPDEGTSKDLMIGQHVYMEPDLGQEEEKEGIWLNSFYIEGVQSDDVFAFEESDYPDFFDDMSYGFEETEEEFGSENEDASECFVWTEDSSGKEDDPECYVWAEDASGKIEKRRVGIGEHDDLTDQYEIVSGLSEDDFIAVPGQVLTEGQRVKRTEFGEDEKDGENAFMS